MTKSTATLGFVILFFFTPVSADPVTEADIVALLEAGVTNEELIKVVEDKGFVGEADGGALARLRQAGATAALLLEIRNAKPKDAGNAAPPEPKMDKADPEQEQAAEANEKLEREVERLFTEIERKGDPAGFKLDSLMGFPFGRPGEGHSLISLGGLLSFENVLVEKNLKLRGPFSTGSYGSEIPFVAMVTTVEGKIHYITSKGKFINQVAFSDGGNFYDLPVAVVKTADMKHGIINKDGDFVVKPIFTSISDANSLFDPFKPEEGGAIWQAEIKKDTDTEYYEIAYNQIAGNIGVIFTGSMSGRKKEAEAVAVAREQERKAKIARGEEIETIIDDGSITGGGSRLADFLDDRWSPKTAFDIACNSFKEKVLSGGLKNPNIAEMNEIIFKEFIQRVDYEK